MVTVTLQIKKGEMDKKYNPSNFFLETFEYNILKKIDEEKSNSQPEEIIAERVRWRIEKADGEDLSDMTPLEGDEGLTGMLPLEGDEKVKEGKCFDSKQIIQSFDSKQIIN